MPLVMGLAEAVKERDEQDELWLRESKVFKAELTSLVAEFGGVVNGDPQHAAPHILNVAFPGVDSEALIVAMRGVVDVATGSACTSASYTPSHVLTAMGLPEEIVKGSLRMSWWGRPAGDLDSLRAVLSSFLPAA